MSRILILIPSLAGVGGSESLVHSLSGVLSEEHEVFQASFDVPGTERMIHSDLPFHALGPAPRLPLPLRPITYFLLASRLRQAKEKLGIDVTISNLWGADLISILSMGRDKKVSLGLINIRDNPTNRLMVSMRSVVGQVYRGFDRVLAICRPLADELRELYDIDAGALGTFRNFVPAVHPQAVWPASSPDTMQRFVFCGRMVAEKNLDALLHAWAKSSGAIPTRQLVVLGGGELQEPSMRTARTLGLSVGTSVDDASASVLFLGMVKRPEDYMVGATAFVLPSRHEGVPTVLLLALSLGLPVIASDCLAGGVRDVLEGGAKPRPDGGEDVAAGVLLPIPDPTRAATIDAWVSAIDQAATDGAAHARWTAGAKELSKLYGEAAVKKSWMNEIARLAAP